MADTDCMDDSAENLRQVEESFLLAQLREWHLSSWNIVETPLDGTLLEATTTVGSLQWRFHVSVAKNLHRSVRVSWRRESETWADLPLQLRPTVDGRRLAHYFHGLMSGVNREAKIDPAYARQARAEIVVQAWHGSA